MGSELESKLIKLISLLPRLRYRADPRWESITMDVIFETVSVVRSMDLDSQPKPESKLMSLITQTVILFNSMDFDSLPEPLSKLISLISLKLSDLNFKSLVDQTLELKPEPELISIIRQLVTTVVISMNPKWKNIIFLCPQVQGYFEAGKFQVGAEEVVQGSFDIFWSCFIGDWSELFKVIGEDATYFRCKGCNGEHHKEYERVPLEVKHPLHLKHTLQLALNWRYGTRECYCCDENLENVFYCCVACDYTMNIACVEKAPLLSIPNPKWHEQPLALFPRKASLACNICALANSNSPFYICPPCDFVAHLRCINLPRVLRISRHPRRLCYTPSFDEGNWSCGVCQRKIDNDYGGYSCIRDGCSYAVHSRCATQKNVWDGIDLEGVPEETEEVSEPYVRINDGIIQHFSHKHHHLRLDENTSRDYDENKQCFACITAIYFGNFYSCGQCQFVLHETCANLSRKLYHPIHPHRLTLALMVGKHHIMDEYLGCSACLRYVRAGFVYRCRECLFKLHVQCATIDEPLVHESHKQHPLFLTSKPGELKTCGVCLEIFAKETFNCIDECDGFALCFKCATIPQKVRYKHDKHILTLSYGQEETSILTYWCEACETKINPKERFYMCDEYCCVTLHMECLIGKDLYMMPGSSFTDFRKQVSVLPNNHHMSRPICSKCKKRCSQKIVSNVLN